jgi:hypothetical protein
MARQTLPLDFTREIQRSEETNLLEALSFEELDSVPRADISEFEDNLLPATKPKPKRKLPLRGERRRGKENSRR